MVRKRVDHLSLQAPASSTHLSREKRLATNQGCRDSPEKREGTRGAGPRLRVTAGGLTCCRAEGAGGPGSGGGASPGPAGRSGVRAGRSGSLAGAPPAPLLCARAPRPSGSPAAASGARRGQALYTLLWERGRCPARGCRDPGRPEASSARILTPSRRIRLEKAAPQPQGGRRKRHQKPAATRLPRAAEGCPSPRSAVSDPRVAQVCRWPRSAALGTSLALRGRLKRPGRPAPRPRVQPTDSHPTSLHPGRSSRSPWVPCSPRGL